MLTINMMDICLDRDCQSVSTQNHLLMSYGTGMQGGGSTEDVSMAEGG